MALTDPPAPGATPLTAEQLQGLKLPITTHGELNAAEQQNILQARLWARTAKSVVMPDMLSREFIDDLHRRMYGNVWAWAGTHRTSDTNIGVTFTQIAVQVHVCLGDARYWLEHNTYSPAEFAVRLHHRLVLIHPYPNGNGRHCRFYADLILTRHFKQERLPWGGGQLGNDDPRRAQYIAALQAADHHDYGPLLAFATS